MKTVSYFWLAVGIGAGLSVGGAVFWPLIGMGILLLPIALIFDKKRKEKLADQGYPDGY